MKTFFQSILAGSALLAATSASQGATLKFDGVNDYLDLGAGAPVLGTNFTQEAWIYPQISDANYHGFLGHHPAGGGNYRSPSIWVTERTKLHVGFGTGAAWLGSITTNVLQSNDWNHVAATYNGTTYLVYVNGQQIFASNMVAAPFATPVRYIGVIDNYFPGLIDEVRLWSLARTAPQIAASWNRRLAGNETGLVAYYPLEEGAGTMTADASGHGYSGSLFNGPLWNTSEDAVGPVVFTRPATLVANTSAQLNALINTNGARTTNRFEWGAASTAVSFDGIDDYVEFARSISNDFTIECWLRSTQGTGTDVQWYNGMGLVDGEVNGAMNDFGLALGAGKVLFGTGSPDITIRSSSAVNDGQWHHVAATRGQTNGAMSLYVDGSLVASGSGGTTILSTPPKIRLGSLASGLNFFQGQLDEVRLWRVVRSPTDIRSNLHIRLTGTEPNLVACYRLDEGTGTTTADATTNGFTGTFVGSPAWMPGARPVFNQMTPPQPAAGTNLVLNLDGVDDHVRVPAGTWFSNEFTIETWVYERSYNNYSRVIDFGNGAPSENVLLALSEGTTGKPNLSIFRGTGGQSITAPNPIPLNQWVHLAATLSSNIGTIYVNGVAVVSGTVTAPNAVNRSNNYIGRSPWPDAYANALIDDLRIWNVARTPDQIRQFMTEAVAPANPDLVLNYRLDELSDSTAVDYRTTSLQNGTLTNGASRLSSLPVMATLSSLAPGTVYHFRGVAGNTNGTSVGNTERFVALVPGSGTALAFDGTDDHVRIVGFGNKMPTTEVTVEFWQRVRSSKQHSTFSLDPDQVGNRFQAHVPWETGMVYWDYGNINTSGRIYYTPPESIVGTWQHFALVSSVSGNSMRIYRNGILEQSKSGAATFTRGQYDLILGKSSNGYFDGELDEFRIWSVARTQEDISRDRNLRLTGTESGLVACYRMDEGTGLALRDATVNASHGLLVNGPLHVPSGASVGIPIAVKVVSTFLNDTSVRLDGLVKPGESGTFSWFQWGTTTAYGSTTAITNLGSGGPDVPVSATLTGLTTNVAYHCRVVASNSLGVVYGADRTFAILPVNSLADSGAGTLRSAIAEAVSGAMILLTNTGTITLTSGELLINKDLSIVGPGAANLTLSGNNSSRVFNIVSGVTVNISGLTIRDGHTPNGTDGVVGRPGTSGASGSFGGGIFNAGFLTVIDCALNNNSSGTGGTGGTGDAIEDSSWGGGAGGSGGYGGAIYNHNSGVLTVSRCSIHHNSCGNGGLGGRGGSGRTGGLFEIGDDGGPGGSGGNGGLGGGVYSAGVASLSLCTLSGNQDGAGGSGGQGGNGYVGTGDDGNWGGGGNGGTGGSGGGICNAGILDLLSCTIVNNSASAGGAGGARGTTGEGGGGNGSAGGNGGAGGIYALAGAQPVQIVNTIVALNTRPTNVDDDVAGAFASLGHNLVGTVAGSSGFSSASGDLLNQPPVLTPLADNGGPTWTHALWPESPAVDAGTNAYALFATDQRGSNRLVCATVDIGAFEYDGCKPQHPSAQTALYFDGVNDHVVSLNANAVNLANRSFTIEAWARRNTTGTEDYILGQGTAATDRGLHFGFRSDNRFQFGFWADDMVTSTTSAITDGGWHHWAATYDTNSRMQRLYLDGILLTNRLASNHYAGTGPILIGNLPWGNYQFHGCIDEIRVWLGVRTEQEIQAYLNRSLTGTEFGLAAYYQFNDGHGTTAKDGVTGSLANLVNGPFFVSSDAPLYRPIVATLAADEVGSTAATLHGVVNPAGPYGTYAWFEYGPSPYFGSSTTSTEDLFGLSAQPVSIAVTNLESGTTYYFRLVAQNNAGLVYGETVKFDTLSVGSGFPVSTRANNTQSSTSPRHITDPEGNIYLAGLFSGSIQFNRSLQATESSTNAFLAKLGRRSDWRWAVNIPVTTNGQVQIKALALEILEHGTNVLVAGTFSGTATFGATVLTAPSGTRAFVARCEDTGTNGNWTWAMSLGAGTNNSANALAVAGDGGIYLAGQFSGATSFGTNTTLRTNFVLTAKGASDAFVAHFDASGQPDWVTQAGGSGATEHDTATALALGTVGEIHATGFFTGEGEFGKDRLPNAGDSDVFLATLTATNGSFKRAISAGGLGPDQGTALASDPSGNIYLVAQFVGAANFGGSPLPELASTGTNLLVAQINRQGHPSLRAAARGACADSIVMAPSGHLYLVGDFTGVMRYGPTSIIVDSGTNANASSDVFVAQLVTGTDALNWADFKKIGGIGSETRGSVSVDPAGSVVVSGTYEQSLHLGYVELSTPNPQEIFLVRLDADGVYEHNLWTIGQALIPPEEALLPPITAQRAKGLPRIEILDVPEGLQDSSEVNSFYWSDAERKLYAIRPVTARIKWPLTSDATNLANVAIAVGRCVWPTQPQIHIAGAPAEVEPANVGFRFKLLGQPFSTSPGAAVDAATLVFNATAPGYTVLQFLKTDGQPVDLMTQPNVFEVVRTVAWNSPAHLITEAAEVGATVTRARHNDPTGKNGFVLFANALYDGVGPDRAYDRATRTGPIIPVNKLGPATNDELVVVWYHTNQNTSIAWPDEPVRYQASWPTNIDEIIIASQLGYGPIVPESYPAAQVYHQPDPAQPGFNPNEEHALLVGDTLYALRDDLNALVRASDPYVLLKYRSPSQDQWTMKVLKVAATNHTYRFDYAGVAGEEIAAPKPLRFMTLCRESVGARGPFYEDYNGKLYARAAGPIDGGTNVVLHWFYPLHPSFFYQLTRLGSNDAPVGTCVPWLDRRPGGISGVPTDVTYHITWPEIENSLQVGENVFNPKAGLPGVRNWASAAIIHDQANPLDTNALNSLVRLYDPLSERVLQLRPADSTDYVVRSGWDVLRVEEDFDLVEDLNTANVKGRLVFVDLPYSLRSRLIYDPLNKNLSFSGLLNETADYGGPDNPLILVNVMTERERERIKRLDGEHPPEAQTGFDDAIDALFHLTRNPNRLDVDLDGKPDQAWLIGLAYGYVTNFVSGREVILTNLVHEKLDDRPKLLTAAPGTGSGYVTLVQNDDERLAGLPVALTVLRVEGGPFRGDLKVLLPDNVFDEKLTLRHSADFGGAPEPLQFEWYYQPATNTSVKTNLPYVVNGALELNGWIYFGSGSGMNDITIGDGSTSSLLTLSDNYFLCRYRGYRVNGETNWSDWVGVIGGGQAQLAEGWIKRVLDGLNPFEARTTNFHESATATYASMIQQAGARYEGDIAFNPSADNLNNVGLIAAYETVLRRGRGLSIDSVEQINDSAANNALLLAAGRIAEFYLLLGNEAYADGADPTIGFRTDQAGYATLAPSIFTFQNQLDSLLEEELALLRGRDDNSATVKAPPFYNRLIWNFTRNEGEVAYSQTYNISDQNADGLINAEDARIMYPQGHGDAWGHYLSATKTYYSLLRSPNYTWLPRTEDILLASVPVKVDYQDERKFARAASAKAKTGAEIADLTYRLSYVDDPTGQYQGYKDTVSDRAWGLSEWARRAAQGAYFDWAMANAILPATDPNPEHTSIDKIDRTTVSELGEIITACSTVQAQLDKADLGLNPLGLAKNVVPFDIDPTLVSAGQTHFEQIYERTLTMMGNAVTVFNHANQLSQSLRALQDTVDDQANNAEDQERDYKNRLIEVFGYPYAGDIGPGGTYPSGYDGPDIYHYMYVNTLELNGDTAPPSQTFTGFYSAIPEIDHSKPISLSWITGKEFFFPEDVPGDPGDRFATNILAVNYPFTPSDFGYVAPTGWGQRRAPGEIQLAMSALVQQHARLKQAQINYDNLLQKTQDQIDLIQIRYNVEMDEIKLVNVSYGQSIGLAVAKKSAEGLKGQFTIWGDKLKEFADATTEGIPKVVGLSTDVTAPARGVVKTLAAIGSGVCKGAAWLSGKAAEAAESSKEDLQNQTRFKIQQAGFPYEVQQQFNVLEELLREEATLRAEAFEMGEALEQTAGRYQSALAKGLRLFDERAAFRRRAASVTQENRYRDMTFRIFRNDAIQKYRAQFDLAAQYVFLAAVAYDFETQLLGGDNGAGREFLTDIIRQRSLGQVENGVPIAGRHGLADPLARLGMNFAVLKGQMGFNNPQTETGRFSLRNELFRLGTNSAADWQAELKKHVEPNLWNIPEFRRYCRPFAPESAGPQPGLVIRFPTTVTFGLNYFGWPLGGGDSAYDPSLFATKVRSVGVWFADYNGKGLSVTPRVYLVPVGADVMRSPSGYDLETREWRVVDQKIPVPFPIGYSSLQSPTWIPVNNSLSDTLAEIRRFSSFRAYHDSGYFTDAEVISDSRLIGRSVWNTEWMLIIPGGTFLYDPSRGLDTFIATVGDIKIFFQTYAYSGN